MCLKFYQWSATNFLLQRAAILQQARILHAWIHRKLPQILYRRILIWQQDSASNRLFGRSLYKTEIKFLS